jgi:hypothetical protein
VFDKGGAVHFQNVADLIVAGIAEADIVSGDDLLDIERATA